MVEQVQIIDDLSIIEDGRYIGLWCGYSLRIAFQNGNISSNLKVSGGIRGFSNVVVEIVDGSGVIASTDKEDIKKLYESYRIKPDFVK